MIVWLLAKGHRNVLPVEGIDFHDDRLFIISEFAPDGSLEDSLGNHGGKAPSIVEAIEIMLGILDGLGYLHKRKIIHRDIKPPNVLLSNNTPRITDFGIAKFIPSETESHALKGSPAYMSPEAWQGNRDEQTDLWSASVVFYELLCGKRPFSGRGQHEVMYSICNLEPQPLPEIIPKALREFIATALKKETNERYRTAGVMRSELQEIYQDILRIGEEPTIVVPPPTPEPTPVPEPQPTPPTIIVPLQPKPQPALPVLQPNPQPSSQPQPELNPDPPLVPKPQSMSARRVNRAVVATIVVIVLAVGAGVWGVVKLKSGNPDAPTVTTPSNISGTNQLKETKTDVGTFVQIPEGNFLMGSENGAEGEKPVRKVKISSFEMGKHEVTQEQWQAVMGNNPSDFKGANHPVEQVSWNDVQEFIKKLNAKKDGYSYRLPTEAEWEYACRAGTKGDYAGNLDEMSWYDKNSGSKTHSVGEKKANAWGLYDMHGNVWEWCSDWYDENYYKQSPNANPSGPSTGSLRVLRGGGWSFDARELRSAIRYRFAPGFRDFYLGFRLVRTYP